eukprot:GILJ01015622.1.p1 GENE.GILJ01015622.1~~GILJ01015622.1.p1  ORF type:complete len:324 (+),score=16.58 GILJ01015622.1:2-973(+)
MRPKFHTATDGHLPDASLTEFKRLLSRVGWVDVVVFLWYSFNLLQFLQAAFFSANFSLYHTYLGSIAPYTVDSLKERPDEHWMLTRVIFNTTLLTIFGLQHSFMARQFFQQFLQTIMPRWMERIVFLLVSSSVLHLVMLYWSPMIEVVWQLNGVPAVMADLLYIGGLGLICTSMFESWRYDLFNFRSGITGEKFPGVPEVVPSVYKFVRQPLFSGCLMSYWAGSTMTTGRLLFALFMTVYTLIGSRLLERDMVNRYGRKWLQYRSVTPRLIPFSTLVTSYLRDLARRSQARGVDKYKTWREHRRLTARRTHTTAHSEQNVVMG